MREIISVFLPKIMIDYFKKENINKNAFMKKSLLEFVKKINLLISDEEKYDELISTAFSLSKEEKESLDLIKCFSGNRISDTIRNILLLEILKKIKPNQITYEDELKQYLFKKKGVQK